jgi:hypothetical protein
MMGEPDNAVDRLIRREEVLEICFWYDGEGFGTVLTAAALRPFLNVEEPPIESALDELARQGCLEHVRGGFRLTDVGRKCGGRLFAESFADFQHGGHGECDAGCCDEEHDHGAPPPKDKARV